jgi:hypothetical protein
LVSRAGCYSLVARWDVITIGYVGQLGRHLSQVINDVNVPDPFNTVRTAANIAYQTQLRTLQEGYGDADPSNLNRFETGGSDLDFRPRFVATATYELPFLTPLSFLADSSL